jgi:hypothetical protein
MGMKLGPSYYGKIEATMLRRVFGSEREEVAWNWREFKDDELHTSYYFSHFPRAVRNTFI